MYRAASKFFGEQGGQHGADPLHWTYHGGGVPFRANGPGVPIMRPGEFEELPIVRDPHVSLFDLSNEEHVKSYLWVLDRIRNGLFIQDHVERHWDDQKKRMLVYIEWSQLYRIMPKGSRETSNGLQSGQSNGNGLVGF